MLKKDLAKDGVSGICHLKNGRKIVWKVGIYHKINLRNILEPSSFTCKELNEEGAEENV